MYCFYNTIYLYSAQIRKAEILAAGGTNGIVPTSYYPPNGVYNPNYSPQSYGQQPVLQPNGQPYYIQPSMVPYMQQGVQPIVPTDTNINQAAPVLVPNQQPTGDTPIYDKV